MVHREPTAQVTLREVGAAEAAPILSPVNRYCTTDETVEGMALHGRCFVISEDGRDVAAYVLQRQGNECFILAGAGGASFDLIALSLPIIEAQASGMASVAFQTKRPGLIRKASKQGYYIAGRAGSGVLMRKELK